MSDSLGQILQRARQDRGVSIEEASQVTHIRMRFLQALEADDAGSLPSVVQGRGFLRLYADYLNLDTPALLGLMAGQPLPVPAPTETADVLPDARSLSGVAPTIPPVVDPQGLEGENDQAADLTDAEAVSDTEALFEPPAALSGIEMVDNTPLPVIKRSQRIFEELGADLRTQRETISLSLVDVEKHTRVRIHYLTALEEGRMQDIPSFVQARGMLANYAHFLNLDSEAYLLRFADGLQARREELVALQIQPNKPSRGKQVSRLALPRFLSIDLLVTGGLIILLVAFVAWEASRVMTQRAAAVAAPTAPPVVDVLLPSAGATVESSPLAATTPQTTTQPAPPNEVTPAFQVSLPAGLPLKAVQISVVAHQRAWMLITADGKVQYNGRTNPGETYTFSGNKQIELLTGSGAALQVYFKDTDLGLLGSVGQVIDLIFGPGGMVTPTPAVTPTAPRSGRLTPATSQTLKPPVTTSPPAGG
ncbi:MAG: DUF4115 domain-containing protein [Anaerolineaceae bacterium]|nr:DUF4115 domain-containing protein [Anaerolineaceae bacterium]